MTTKQEAEEWYKKEVLKYKSKNDDPEYKAMERRKIGVGSFINFNYKNPKTKDLKYWDTNPLIVIIYLNGNDAMGLNFHYVNPKFRKTVLSYILKLNRTNIKNGKRLTLDYKMIKEFIYRNGLQLMIHRYKVNRITSLRYIKLSELRYVAELPLEKFVFNGDMTEEQLYRMINAQARTSRKAKNVRTGRKVK